MAYLDERELDIHFIESLATVYSTQAGICFVLYGGLVYQERAFSGPRFRFPYGVDMSAAVFLPQPEHPSDELIITEGTADALAAAQEGYRSVAMLGSLVPQRRFDLVKSLVRSVRRTIYIPDNDAPGYAAADRLLRNLGCPVQLGLLPYGVKDLCELPREKRKAWLRHEVG